MKRLGRLVRRAFGKERQREEIRRGPILSPRVLIDVMVELSQPQLNEVIQDPAAGTGGFLIRAYHYLHNNTFANRHE